MKVTSFCAMLAEDGEDPSDVSAPSGDAMPPKQEAEAEKADTKPEPRPAAEKETSAEPEKPKALATTQKDGDRIKASPLARRIAAQKGVDLASIKGSGPHGRIIRKDVEAAEAGAPAKPQAAASPVKPDGLILPQVLDNRIYAPDSYELVPLDGMRKTVAKRLTESFMQVPHFPLEVDIQLDKLLSSRSAINATAPEGVKVSVKDMLIKASAHALMAEPDCNASHTDKGISYQQPDHITATRAQ